MMRRLCVGVCSLMCLAAATSVAQGNPWNGSWKTDAASVKYEGPTFTVAMDPGGYSVTRGSEVTKIVCDGKPQKQDDTMVSCVKSAAGFSLTVTRGGKQIRKTAVSVSADGKTRTSKSENTPANGAPFSSTAIATRVSGGPGLAGVWKETKNTSSDDKGLLTIAVKGDSVDFKETDTPKPITCKLDGSETKIDGGATMAVKLADAHTLKVTYRGDGKVRRENTFALSADGKTITETDVTPAPAVSTLSLSLHKM
jgi:hypothetical protein